MAESTELRDGTGFRSKLAYGPFSQKKIKFLKKNKMKLKLIKPTHRVAHASNQSNSTSTPEPTNSTRQN